MIENFLTIFKMVLKDTMDKRMRNLRFSAELPKDFTESSDLSS